MRLIKSINNNAALGLDSKGREIVVFGKGIGAVKMPFELKDLTKVSRTFYGINDEHIGLLNEIPEDVFLLTNEIVEYSKQLIDDDLNPNLIFTLADHINFAIERFREHMHVGIPRSYELETAFPQYYEVAAYALLRIQKRFRMQLPPEEKTSIALHFINARKSSNEPGKDDLYQTILEGIISIIESFFDNRLDRESYHYYRFSNHIRRFVDRKSAGSCFDDITSSLFEVLKNVQPQTYKCVQQIDQFILSEFGERCTKQELVYLMVHVDAVCSKIQFDSRY